MSDIVERLRDTASCAGCIVDRERAAEAADTITRLTAENEKLRAALETVMIGGNHLVSIIGADHPPYGTSYDEVLAHYGGGVKYEAWCCWNAIMEARAALSGDKQ